MDARRLIPIGAAVTALLVLAGIASHGRPLSTGRGPGPSASFFDYVATTLVILAVGMVAVIVAIVAANRGLGGGAPRRGKWNIVSALIMFAGAALLAYGIANSKFERRLHQLEQRHANGEPKPPRAHVKPMPTNLRNPRTRWDEVLVVGILVGGVLAYFLVTRRPRALLRPLARRRDELSRALDESLDDLRNDPDVRRAIIAAYARMEHTLATAGIRRKPSEAPFEFLERSLLELEASAGAAHRLTELFERAKFSHHEPDEAMRSDAIDALLEVRDELRRELPHTVAA